MLPPIFPSPTKPICTLRTVSCALATFLAGCGAAAPPADDGRGAVARVCRELPRRLATLTPPVDAAGLRRVGREAAPFVIDALAELTAVRTRGVRTYIDELEDALSDARADLDSLAAGHEPGAATDSLGLQATRIRSVTAAMGIAGCAGPDNAFLDPLREPVYLRELPLADTPVEVQQLDEPLHAAAEHRAIWRAMERGDGRAERRARRAVVARISAARAARAR